MFGKKPYHRDIVEQALIDFAEEIAMIEHGWRIWPANASEESIKYAINHYIETGERKWYAPGEIEEPVITEGKLIIKKK